MKKTLNSLKNKKNDFYSISNKCEGQSLTHSELVKPIDFESYYFNNKNNIFNDPNRTLVIIPVNDIKINKVDRVQIVFNNGVPSYIKEIFDINLLAKLCVEFYTSQWTVNMYKEVSYNSTFWGLPNVHSQLAICKDQKFLIDIDNETDYDNLLTFKTKGIYFESSLAVCDPGEYEICLRNREDILIDQNIMSKEFNIIKNTVPKLLNYSLCELNDGTKVLKESIPRDDHEQSILELDTVNTVKEIGGFWILLAFDSSRKLYLYTGSPDNQKQWFKILKDLLGSHLPGKLSERSKSQDTLLHTDDSAQGMLSKLLQENEEMAVTLRKKDHKKIFWIYPDIRNQIKTKSYQTPFYDIGIIENAQLNDEYIRSQIQQCVSRNFIKLTVHRLVTSAGIQDEHNKCNIIPPEPFFISFCVIQISDGRRISEEFYWNPNQAEVENLLPNELFLNKWSKNKVQMPTNKTPFGLPTLSNVLQSIDTFILTIPYHLDQTCLLVRVEKVFSGPITAAIDKYLKSGGVMCKKKDGFLIDNNDFKTGLSINKSMKTYCSNIGHYRMPFGFSVHRLSIHGVRSLRLYKYDGNRLSDDDLIKQIQNVINNSNSLDSSTCKYGAIHGFLDVSIEQIGEETVNNLTGGVNYELVCKTNSETNNSSSCYREVKEFICDSLKTENYSSNKNPNTSSIQSSSKPNSAYGSMASLHHNYSDDNSSGDITPPVKFRYTNLQQKSMNYVKANSASLGRINSEDSAFTRSAALQNQFSNLFSSVNQDAFVAPHLDFCHLLYVYPRILNFSNQNSFQRARNLSCFVELRDSDKLDSLPLQVIFTRPSSKQPVFDTWANTSVTYHDSSPNFSEEIKIQLPLKLNRKHHLLFRFYHVSCDGASVPNARQSCKKPLETPVGFSWLSLIDQNQTLKSGSFSLPVAVNLTTEYLEEKHPIKNGQNGFKNNIQWVDGQKLIFTVLIRPETSIFTDNIQLQKFFQVCSEKMEELTNYALQEKKDHYITKIKSENDSITCKTLSDTNLSNFRNHKEDAELKNTIKGLSKVDVTNLIKFFVPIFNQLLNIVTCTASNHSEISKTAVNAIISLAICLRTPKESSSTKLAKRNTKMIKSYIKFVFDASTIAPVRVKRTVHESLVQTISELINPPFRDANFINSFLFNSFLFYSIIIKSMSQSFEKQSKINCDRRDENLFSMSYTEILQNMIFSIINCIFDIPNSITIAQSGTLDHKQNADENIKSLVYSANKDLARFISRLLNIMNRSFVFQRIHQYMKIINARINMHGHDREYLCKMKFDFIEILSFHEHFLPLNAIKPCNPSDKTFPAVEVILSESYCKQHYLVGLLLQQIHQQMNDVFSSNHIRRMPFVILRNLLAKHVYDDRYNKNNNIQARIAALYLPLLSIVLENPRTLCFPGNLHSKTNIHDIYELTDRSLSVRPISTLSGETFSTSSSTGASFEDLSENSVYGLGFGTNSCKSVRGSQSYLGKDGQVEDHWLKKIAGLADGGGLRTLSTRRYVDSETSSVHSTSTLTGLDEIQGGMYSNNLENETIIDTNISSNNESSFRRFSLQRPGVSNSNSCGRKAALSFNLRKNSVSSQRTNIMTSSMFNRNPEIKSSIYLSDNTQKDLFLCLIHIFHTVSPKDLTTALCFLTVQERLEFLQLLIYAIHHFKYPGRKMITNFESISNSSQLQNKKYLCSSGPRPSITGLIDDIDNTADTKAFLEGNLSTECGLVVLDVLSIYCIAFKQEILTYNPDHVIFKKIIDIYLTLLSINQSETVLRHVFISLRIFISNFSKVLFSNCHRIISDLSLHALRFLDTRFNSVRLEACGFLYRMMKSSFDTFSKPGLNRVHLQMIVAVSKIDQTVGVKFNDSLNYLKRLAELEMQKIQYTTVTKPRPNAPIISVKPKPTIKSSMQSFFEEVTDLIQRIRTVLMATVQMNEHKDDHEMLVDLQYSLAKSYSSNPALRRAWLEKIYSIHEKNNSRSEMAMCKAHIAAMISEYLKRKENFSISCENFKEISPNIPLEEGGMRDDSVQLEVHYTKDEVVKVLQEVAVEFDAAGLWEVLKHVYQLLIPIYEKKRDYEHLAETYQHLASGYLKIKNSESTNQRLIGSYYRVAFYGKPFENLSGKIFIYRFDSGKQFCVVREELQKLFSKKHGSERVQMIVENHVDKSKLNHEIASIQVTHVEPFSNEDEKIVRQSMFDRQYNISKFLSETPFVKNTQNNSNGILKSKQTDDLSIQWKRRTILTVDASFPHLKKRLEVIDTKEIDFSPIERAIDEIKLKNRQLVMHLSFNKYDNSSKLYNGSNPISVVRSGQFRTNSVPLLMDMHISGALLPQVNQGPMAYARVFLQKQNQFNYPQEKVNQLKIQFMEFLTICHFLLIDYCELMSHVQEQKYNVMHQALDNYRLELSNLISEEILLDEEKLVISTVSLADIVKKNFWK